VVPYVNERWPHNAEVIISENGSSDETLKIAQCYANSFRNVFVISMRERGKGLAIRRGMQFANARWRYMCDVDLSTPIEVLDEFLSMAVTERADVVIGSREVDRSQVRTTLARRVIGRVFHQLVAELVPGVQDTQCGFKLFSSRAAAVFSLAKLNSMAFDVEALYLAGRMGYRIVEMPVPWEHNPDSRVRLVMDSATMARDIMSIPWMHTQIKLPA
jgi:dolichyl-phosphate beta-glucosyltransferase